MGTAGSGGVCGWCVCGKSADHRGCWGSQAEVVSMEGVAIAGGSSGGDLGKCVCVS